jgi:20S proteasome subunit beta 2
LIYLSLKGTLSNYIRNQLLIEKKVIHEMSHKKTGTTIVGVKYEGGVVLGADTRATGGSIVV